MGFERGNNRGRGGNRGGGRGRSSFGSDRGGGGRGRGSFGRGRGRGGGDRGGNRSFGSNGGNRSFDSNRSIGSNGGDRKSFGGGNRGGNRGGDRNSFGNRGGGGGFFKPRGNGFQRGGGGGQNGKGSLSFQEDRKRKYESDSDEGDEITEKPKGILKTPRLDIKSDKKKVTMKDGSLGNSFQAKTPATPHPVKGKPSISTPKVIDFNESDDDMEDEEMSGVEGMDFEDSDVEDLESFEDMDDASDLEEAEDLEHLGGADDSLSEDGIEEIESADGIEEVGSGEESDSDDDEPAVKSKPVAEKPSKAVAAEKPTKATVAETSSSKSAKQLENDKKLELYKTALYVASPGEAVERKTLTTCHPFLIGVWKAGKEGILLVFDSEKSRNSALKWFQTAQDADYKNFKPVKADEVKALLEDTTKDIDWTKLHFSHVPERIAKRHFKILFPEAESIDASVCTDVVVGFKSAKEAQTALAGLGGFRLFGAPVLIKFHRASAQKSVAVTPAKKVVKNADKS